MPSGSKRTQQFKSYCNEAMFPHPDCLPTEVLPSGTKSWGPQPLGLLVVHGSWLHPSLGSALDKKTHPAQGYAPFLGVSCIQLGDSAPLGDIKSGPSCVHSGYPCRVTPTLGLHMSLFLCGMCITVQPLLPNPVFSIPYQGETWHGIGTKSLWLLWK